MSKLYKFVRLSGRDRCLLIQAVLLLIAIKLGLALFSFQALRRWLGKIAPTPKKSSPQPQLSRERTVWAANVAGRVVPGGVKCLARALAVQVLLNRQGDETKLWIGVAKDEGGNLEAHAWLESQGEVIVGRLRDWERFIPLADFKD